jgi:hypothetical protein
MKLRKIVVCYSLFLVLIRDGSAVIGWMHETKFQALINRKTRLQRGAATVQ